MSAVAVTPSEIDPAWMTAALRHGALIGENAVAALYFAKVVRGMMLDSFRFELCWERDDTALPVTIVGKFAAADPTSNATGKQFNQYRAEACFYADIAPALPARVPRAWYSQVSDNGDLTLLMEDLRDARSIDQATQGCSLEDAAAALREFAKLHGHHWAAPSLDRMGWLKQQDQKAVRMAAAVPDALAGFVHRYADMLEPEYLLLVARVHLDIWQWRSIAQRRGRCSTAISGQTTYCSTRMALPDPFTSSTGHDQHWRRC